MKLLESDSAYFVIATILSVVGITYIIGGAIFINSFDNPDFGMVYTLGASSGLFIVPICRFIVDSIRGLSK